MKLNKTLLALAISVLLITACSDEEKDESLTDGSQNAASGINDASTNGLNGGSSLNGSGLNGSGLNGNGNYDNSGDYASTLGPEFNDPNNPLSKRTVYFMLDSSEVLPDFIPVIAAHAQYLIANPSQKLTLEGNADERGSREYNIALGEQRAKSVAVKMKAQGVSENQLTLVSYGEEKPAAFGSDEAAWEKNRRVEIVYQPK